MVGYDDDEELHKLRLSLKNLLSEIRELMTEIGKWTMQVTAPNMLFVDNLLRNAKTMIGTTAKLHNDNSHNNYDSVSNDSGDFVSNE